MSLPEGQIERRGGREIRVQRSLLLAGVTLLGLVPAACTRVPSHFALPQLAAADRAFIPTLEAYTIAPVGGGNSVDVLLNGDQIFPAQLAAIRSARETITYAQYFYVEGPIGREIADALADRCRAGVRAHILLDGFGTSQMPTEYRDTMTRAGCQVATFRPLSPLSLLAAVGFGRANKRNHRRILVVDGRVGFTGGSGISPKWTGDGRTKGHWRETDVRVEGPVVASLQGAFVENWLDATKEGKRAVELDPLSLVINADLGADYYLARRYDEAIAQQRKTLEMDPGFYYAHFILGEALAAKGAFEQAIEEYRKAHALDDDPWVLGLLGHAYASSGNKTEALKILDQLKELSTQRYVSAYSFAILYLGLGDKQEALRWLEQSYQDRAGSDIAWIRVYSLLDPLRGDPRFEALAEKIVPAREFRGSSK